jgi:hypothetical protein
MKGSLDFFRETSWEGKERWPRRTPPGGANSSLVQGGRRRAVVDLVQWSFAIALTPIVLGLAWRLIFGIGNSSGRG